MSQLGPSFKIGMLLFVLVFGVSAVAFYGVAQFIDENPTAAADGGAGGPAGGPVSVTIVGQNLTFNPRSITASSGAQVSVTFDNQDAGILHNIHFFSNRNRSATLAKTDIAAGPVKQTLNFAAPTAPGSYPFICDAHPDTMTGTLTVR